eukprot:TRINITY_DN601_c0_g1_i1.p1 TRINITY_DN601_c0_g1~~TRINITY_DN601_c0_g1_i1.p1  ORF type:complete len:129 (-),score=39.49 TRINITY_DN601_c0_g1_i1:382-768(-)
MSDIDTRFTTAVSMIQDAYVGKTQTMQSEINRWQQIHQQQQEKMANLEEENRNARRRILNLEAQIGELQRENAVLYESRSAIVDKYNLLKQQSLQLQSLRKQIATIVTSDAGMDLNPDLLMPGSSLNA